MIARCSQLADKGNGNYAYVDSLREGHRALVVRAGGTLVAVAKDVKVQVDFDPAAVRAWRLVGYENRVMPNEDFREDAKDAGEIGAGHVVTALFELEPAGKPGSLGVVRVRSKEPDGDVAAESSFPMVDGGACLAEASADLRFAAAVAGFGMLLRGSEHAGSGTWHGVLDLARSATGQDAAGERGEFLLLAECAARLAAGHSPDAAISATVRWAGVSAPRRSPRGRR